jgi:phosphotriesterase-related protein
VQTVLGEVEPEELGVTAMHEHLYIDLGRRPATPERRAQELRFANQAAAEFKAAGGGTIVDLSCRGMGQDVGFLQEVSRATGVRVVSGTGFYYGQFLPDYLNDLSVDDVAELFVRELHIGINGSDAKAGIIGEIGTSIGHITPLEEKVFRAAARAQIFTGVAISTHTGYGTMGLEQLDILESEGADLGRVVVGHCDINPDIEYHLAIARRGATLQYDTVGKERWRNLRGELYCVPEEQRIRLVAEIVRHGYAGQLVLSSDWMMEKFEEEQSLNPQTLGKFRMTYVLSGFIPKLMEIGIDSDTIHRILIENPRGILTPSGAAGPVGGSNG